MELSRLQVKIADLGQQIAELPAGSVTKKMVKGKEYFYYRWTEDKKRRESIFLRKMLLPSGSRLPSERRWNRN